MKQKTEAELFDRAMDKLLKADPVRVKAAMKAEKEARSDKSKAKRASSDHASDDRD